MSCFFFNLILSSGGRSESGTMCMVCVYACCECIQECSARGICVWVLGTCQPLLGHLLESIESKPHKVESRRLIGFVSQNARTKAGKQQLAWPWVVDIQKKTVTVNPVWLWPPSLHMYPSSWIPVGDSGCSCMCPLPVSGWDVARMYWSWCTWLASSCFAAAEYTVHWALHSRY